MDTWAKVLASPNFSNYLRNVFDFGRQAILTVVAGIENLQYKDAKLRGEYRQCLSDLQRLRNKVIEYIDRAEAHPICNEGRRKAILDELQDTDKEGRLDVHNTRKFPRTIDFVSKLTNWLDTMANNTGKSNNVLTPLIEKRELRGLGPRIWKTTHGEERKLLWAR